MSDRSKLDTVKNDILNPSSMTDQTEIQTTLLVAITWILAIMLLIKIGKCLHCISKIKKEQILQQFNGLNSNKNYAKLSINSSSDVSDTDLDC